VPIKARARDVQKLFAHKKGGGKSTSSCEEINLHLGRTYESVWTKRLQYKYTKKVDDARSELRSSKNKCSISPLLRTRKKLKEGRKDMWRNNYLLAKPNICKKRRGGRPEA